MGGLSSKNGVNGPTSHTRLIENDKDSDEFGSVIPRITKPVPYPKSVFFILTTETCERFSFYGMRTILIFYLKFQLLYTEDTSTVLFHTFTMLCFFTPILGALLADLTLGRYKTILWLSAVFLIGNSTIALSAATPVFPTVAGQNAVALFGLFLVAVGTGGIKPCVSAFGGDQFKLPEQQGKLSEFFSVFYFCINTGALLSTLITPTIRENVQCFGGDCYLAAFALPAVLMAVALAVYVSGSSTYKKVPASGTILTSTAACVWLGTVGKVRSMWGRAPRMSHWLDHARAQYDDNLVEDVRTLTSIMWLYLPLPFFWALFDQQGSRWTFQAARMNGTLIPGLTVQPDQVQVINPFLILLMVPVMERWGYPLLARCALLTTYLQRVTTGGLLAALAFVLAAVVEWEIQNRVATGGSPLSIAWLFPQYFVITMGEVLFSISGLQFSFVEAPASMKSVMQACWLLTISVGNLLVVIVASDVHVNSQVTEFLLFAGLMFINMLIFAVMAHYYVPYKPVKVIPDRPSNNNSPCSLLRDTTPTPSLEDDPTLYSYDNLKNKYDDVNSGKDEEETELYRSTRIDQPSNISNSRDYSRNNYSNIGDSHS